MQVPEKTDCCFKLKVTVVFLTRKVFNSNNFSIAFIMQRFAHPFRRESIIKQTFYRNKNIQTYDKAFKGIVVNRTLPSWHGGLPEITLKFPLFKVSSV